MPFFAIFHMVLFNDTIISSTSISDFNSFKSFSPGTPNTTISQYKLTIPSLSATYRTYPVWRPVLTKTWPYLWWFTPFPSSSSFNPHNFCTSPTWFDGLFWQRHDHISGWFTPLSSSYHLSTINSITYIIQSRSLLPSSQTHWCNFQFTPWLCYWITLSYWHSELKFNCWPPRRFN